GFFGMKIASYNETLYVERIECINVEAEVRPNEKILSLYFAPVVEGEMNTNVVQLEWKVYPENATYRNVIFVYDETTTCGYVTDVGTVVFNRKGTIVVNITSTDGQNIRETIRIVAM
ncbi:MAG: hypothetical protein PHO33_03510, partial [Clostridia bacterium]|nr:hypothetical protein [Clostridia bacterium]